MATASSDAASRVGPTVLSRNSIATGSLAPIARRVTSVARLWITSATMTAQQTRAKPTIHNGTQPKMRWNSANNKSIDASVFEEHAANASRRHSLRAVLATQHLTLRIA